MKFPFILAILTASAFLAAAFFKFQDPFRHDFYGYLSLAEPLFAVGVIAGYTNKPFRCFTSFLFATMCAFVLNRIINGDSSCGCLGRNQSIPIWAVFSFDLCMCLQWLMTCFDAMETRLKSLHHTVIVSSLTIIISVSSGLSIQAYSNAKTRRENVDYIFVKAKLLSSHKPTDMHSIVKQADAAFFAQRGCTSCIDQALAFASSCKIENKSGIIVLPDDIDDTEPFLRTGMLIIQIKHGSNFTSRFPAAVRFENGVIVGEFDIYQS